MPNYCCAAQKTGRIILYWLRYKGYKDKLAKLDKDGNVENRNAKNEPIFKNINGYAVNGAVHYANAVLHHTAYTDIIAIGMTGHKDENTAKSIIKSACTTLPKAIWARGKKSANLPIYRFSATAFR